MKTYKILSIVSAIGTITAFGAAFYTSLTGNMDLALLILAIAFLVLMNFSDRKAGK